MTPEGAAPAADAPCRSREPGGPAEGRPWRVAYLVSHPIQYQAPLLRLLGAQPDLALTVFFQSDQSVREFHDAGFGRPIAWDVPLLDGYRYEFLPALGRRDRLIGSRPWSYGIAKRLRRGRFDCLWVHGYARWFNWLGIGAARLAAIPVLLRDEATAFSNPRSPLKAALKRHAFFRMLGAACDGFLAIGTLNRQYYIQNGIPPDRIFAMPYCVDNAYFAAAAAAAAPRREELRARLGLSPGRPVVLYAAKFEPRKRPEDLLAAFARLLSRNSIGERPYLLFVGDGERRPDLQREARAMPEDVRFLGFRNQSEMPALLELCDVFVLPSEREPWGLVVNEAMAAGRAVIVSDRVGCGPDLVRDGVNGHVYPVGDVGALSSALARVLDVPGASVAMGRESAAIIADWTYERDLEGLRAALAATAGRRGPA